MVKLAPFSCCVLVFTTSANVSHYFWKLNFRLKYVGVVDQSVHIQCVNVCVYVNTQQTGTEAVICLLQPSVETTQQPVGLFD